MIVYETHALTKCYPGSIVANRNIHLQVLQGEVFGLLGSNGAGKSTLIRQLAGLLKPTTGSVKLFGRAIEEDPLWIRLNVGYMPQDPRALGSLTVGQALYFTARLRGRSRQAARAERDRLLDLWHLGACRDRPISRVSGGQRRVTSLATTMAGAPRVLILDEPANDLDPERRHLMWGVLRSLQAEGTTIILVTHDVVEAERAIDRVGIMRAGELVAVGRPEVLKRELVRRVRMELRFPPDQPPRIPGDIRPREAAPGRWVLRLNWSQILEVLSAIDTDELDIKIYSPTLEDLYLHHATG
jgi:ABC-2 type transport system ATP-binding protein